MKTKFIAFTVGLILVAGMVRAQDEKYGSDRKACTRNYTLYKEFHRQKNYEDALGPWYKTIKICPKFSTKVWSDGEKMFKVRIDRAKDLVAKEVLIDSLMWIYDQRIKYFGDDPRFSEGYILGNKGVALLKYRKEQVLEGYKILQQSIQLQGKASKPPVLLTYMQASRQLFKDGLIEAGQVLKDYEMVMDQVDVNLKDKPNDRLYTIAKNGIETHFTKSGAADCDALVALYEPQFDAHKTDEVWLKKISRQLRKAGCAGAELYVGTSEALYAINPDAEAGHNLAVMFMKQEEFDKAVDYLKKAVAIGQESDELADMYYELAYINYSNYKDYKVARQYAKKAISARPNWGDPYILIGQLYIAARQDAFDNEFDQSTVFWAAIDKFARAKAVDPEVADKANDMIRQYSQYFPSSETAFYYTLKEGDSYKVGGWINETTKVRFSK
ncbi:MAG: tetratricopeptide repeat protein [Bacteroidales bacterium]|nr:tetratricopeptide repeat protein [Bacteroidales bacterium]